MKRAAQLSDQAWKRNRTAEEQPGVYFEGRRYMLWPGSSEPLTGKRYYVPVLEGKDVDPEQLQYARSRLYLYADNPEELATPSGILNDLCATARRFERPEDKTSTVKELNLVLAFHPQKYRAHLLNQTLCLLLEGVRELIPTKLDRKWLDEFEKAVKKVFAVSLLKTYPGVDFHAPVWSHADKKLTTPNQVYLEVLEKLKAVEPHVLELWEAEEKDIEELRASLRTKGRNKVFKNTAQLALDSIAKWRVLTNYTACNTTGVCLRRRKVPRLIVDLILKRISQQ